MLKSGNLYKLGDGPINFNWNLRFVVLDGKIFIHAMFGITVLIENN